MPKHLAYVPHICSSFSEHPLPRREQKKERDSKQENKTKKPKQEKVESLFD
jgi:hypothetical protein